MAHMAKALKEDFKNMKRVDFNQMQADLMTLADAVIHANDVLDNEGIGWRMAEIALPVARKVKGEQ